MAAPTVPVPPVTKKVGLFVVRIRFPRRVDCVCAGVRSAASRDDLLRLHSAGQIDGDARDDDDGDIGNEGDDGDDDEVAACDEDKHLLSGSSGCA